MFIHTDAAHVIVRDRRHLDRLPRQIDPIRKQTVDHGPECFAQACFGHMTEGQEYTARGRTPPGFHFFHDRITGDVPRCVVAPLFGHTVIGKKFPAVGIQQLSAQLVAEWIPHDRIHADKTRRKMTNGKILDELHIGQVGARA